jgi:acyl-coenzyme A thioesterase PaaI-like protein
MSIVHHDLCFGCGSANLFGLQIELEPVEQGVSGRFFVKQDHQGPPGFAHGGVVAAALDEAMALAVHSEGTLAWTGRLELDLIEPAPVGTFVELEARIDGREGRRLHVSAYATVEGEGGVRVARAKATFVEAGDERPPR